jgi:hypothetical protein
MFPTCAECAGIGITAIAPLLWDMEDDCGPEVMKAFVLAYGGREVSIGPVKTATEDQDLVQQAKAWIFKKRGAGKLRIPKGPGARAYRAAWTIYQLLKAGASLDETARRTGCDMRAVSNNKQRLRQIGALPAKD